MKTSNLIITFGLFSLLLSPASIFGMETRKRTYVDVTREGIRVTQKNHTLEIDQAPSYQHTDSSEKLSILTWLTWFKDNVISSPGQNVLTELRQKTFEKGSTPNLRRLEKAVKEFLRAGDYRNLTELLELCNQQNIKIYSTVLMKSIHQFMQNKKAEIEQELAKVTIVNYDQIAVQANKKLKRLKTFVDTEVKQFTDLMKKRQDSVNEDIEKHCKEIRMVKRGQLFTHQVNAMFKNQIDGHNSDDEDSDEYLDLIAYDNRKILEKPTVKKFKQLQQLRKDISTMLDHLTEVNKSFQDMRGIKAITKQ